MNQGAEPAREQRVGGLSYAPLFRIDPGWPFVIAGLALIVSAVLIPAQRELHDLEQQLKVHRAYEEKANAELLAYEQFLSDVQRGDPRLLERLVRAQLNKMPKDDRPLLLMPTANDTVPQWIESSVTVEIPEPQPYADTLLARIASGPRRLWVLASGTFLVFMGILFVPSTGSRRPVRREELVPVAAPVAAGASDAGDIEDSVEDVVEEEAIEEEAAEASADSSADSSAAQPVLDEAPPEIGAAAATEVEPLPSPDTAEAYLAEPDPEPVVETVPEPVSVAAAEPETLDSAIAPVETFAAQDVHELQYGAADAVEEIRAATDSIPSEVEADDDAEAPSCVIETFPSAAPSLPAPTDRALDGMSLFSGIDDARWIDTRDPRG
ncbi:MAG: hypothetical protein RL325_408 [Planctomycetota bacterium]